MEAIASFDLGTSGSKIIGSYQEEAYPCREVEKFWLIDPSVQELTEASYKALLKDVEEYGHAIESNAVSFVDPENPEKVLFYRVGCEASMPGRLMTDKRKFQDCLIKILSALGYMAVKGFGTSEETQIILGVLLPYNEIEDKELLAKWIRKAVERLEFNGVPVRNLNIEKVRIMPEGYGIYRQYKAQRVLILGHRDMTLMVFKNGKMLSDTVTFPSSGFHDFLLDIRFALSYELEASDVIYRAGRKLNPTILMELTQTKRESELEQLRCAVSEAREQYWLKRKAQLESLSYAGVEAIAVSGGTASYFNREIAALYKKLKIDIHCCEELMVEFQERFDLKEESVVLQRFADCYGFYKSLPGVAEFCSVKSEVA